MVEDLSTVNVDEKYFINCHEEPDFSNIQLKLEKIVYVRQGSAMPRGRDLQFSVSGIPPGVQLQLFLVHSGCTTLALSLPQISKTASTLLRPARTYISNQDLFTVRCVGTGLFDLCLYKREFKMEPWGVN